MKGQERDAQIRSYIIDSLVARSGKALTPDLIYEITGEILKRVIEVGEPSLLTLAIDHDVSQ